jgi:cytochrome c biogenesis protein CcdA
MQNPVVDTSVKTQPPRRRPFFHRFLLALGLSAMLIGLSLGLGILGYHFVAGFNWVDSLLNASMILSGMGPVNPLNSDAAKVFASAYALFSGLIFIAATGILIAPIFHRVLHRFHIEERDSR